MSCRFRFGLFLAVASAATASAGAVTALGPVVVSTTRTPEPVNHVAATVHYFDGADLRDTPALTLDGALRSVPAFTLFRRSDSLTANPTAQGVSLRGLGPSGASRSLVLLDGVPLNDPFGGWVAWTKVPRESLLGVEIVPGGGASAWGNAALSGVLHVRTQPWLGGPTQLAASAGEFGTRSAELLAGGSIGPGQAFLNARVFATDGFSIVRSDRRGPIDIPAWSRHRFVRTGWRQQLASGLEFSIVARAYDEKRGNGTPYQQNRTRERFLSWSASSQPANAFAWDAAAYVQTQAFASTFSAVNATRTAETPASDQFDVPATAWGATWTGTARHNDDARTSFGGDVRFMRGETREHFMFSGGDFARQRVAGGEQAFAGIFGLHQRPLSPRVRATLGARLDFWRDAAGHRRESDRTNGAVLRQDRYPTQDGTELSPSAGLVWQPEPAWRVRFAAQHAFRRPTLNELYRPFRVGPTVTEANAALATERVTSTELGVEWTLTPRPATTSAAPSPLLPPSGHVSAVGGLTLGATVFHNDLRDAVGNVTLFRGPGTFPIVGFIPAGGFGRQRLNLDRTRVQGFEVSARWRPLHAVTFGAVYQYNDATVRAAAVAPALTGRRVAQVPRHSATLETTWRAPGDLIFSTRARWIGRQFEDDENQLVLGEAVVVDAGLSKQLNERIQLFANVENLTDAEIETGRTADGIVTTGTRRLATFGVRTSW